MARSVQVVITADARGMSRGVAQANAQLQSLNATAKQSQASLAKVDGLFSKFSQGAVAAAGIAAVGGAIMQVVNAASELQQSAGAVEAIFDSQAQTVLDGAGKWQQYGLSQSQALQSSALLGNQLKQLGYEGDNLTNTTDQLLMTAADMAATFGGTTPKALEALQAALRGSYARLDEFGINISETMVTAKASTEGLTTQQAALALVLEQSGEFAGQATRELDTFASRQQAAAAAIENAKANLGEGLLPVATSVASALGSVGSALAALPPSFVSLAGTVGVAAAAFKGIGVASAAAQAKLAGMEVALNRANKPTRALAAGLGQLAVAKLATGLQLAAGAFIVAQFAMQKWADELQQAVPSTEDLNTQLLAVNTSLADMKFQFDTVAGQRPFDGQADGLNEIVDALERGNALDFEWLPFTKNAVEQKAAEEFIKRQAEAIKQLQASNPELAARRYDELVAAISDLPVDQQRQWLDLLEQSSSSAEGASGGYLTLAESIKAVTDAQKAMLEQFGIQDFLGDNAQAQQDYAEAVEAAVKSVEDGKRGLAGYTAEQIAQGKAARSSSADTRNQSAALFDLAKSGREAAVSQGLASGSAKAAGRAAQQARSDFIAQAQAMGLSKGEAKALADQLGLIPRDIKTNYKLNKGNADIELAALKDRLAGVTGTKYADIIVRTTYQGKPLAVPGQVGPALPFSRSQTSRAASSSVSSSLNLAFADGVSIGSAILAGARKSLSKGVTVPVKFSNFIEGKANFAKLFEIDAKVAKKNQDKYKEIVDKTVAYWQAKYEKLYSRLDDLERDRAALARSLADSISAFSITDALSGARDVAQQIAQLQKEAADATTESWAHVDPILAEMRATTDPVRLAQLQNTYNTLIAAGPRVVADTARRAEIEAQIAELRNKDDLSGQIADQVSRTEEFAALLRSLKRQGLSADALAEIAQAGPEAGLELARQLAANSGLRDQWAAAFQQMNKFAEDAGKAIAKYQFNPDITKVEAKLKDLWKRSARDFEDKLQERLDKANLKVKVEVDFVTKGKSTASATAQSATYNITINGAIDPEGTARSVKRVLAQHDRRVGVS